jgi:uncharacterized protein HemX
LAEKNESKNVPVDVPMKKEESGYMTYLLFIWLTLLLAAAFIFYQKKQAQKIQKQREDFIKWKEEQERLKNAGKPVV